MRSKVSNLVAAAYEQGTKAFQPLPIAVLLAATLVLGAAIYLSYENATRITLLRSGTWNGLADPVHDLAEVHLNIEKFDSAIRVLSGDARIIVRSARKEPETGRNPVVNAELTLIRLREEYVCPLSPDMQQKLQAYPISESVGGGTELFELQADRGSFDLTGEVPFSLAVSSHYSSFWYPFDSYDLRAYAIVDFPSESEDFGSLNAIVLTVFFSSGDFWARPLCQLEGVTARTGVVYEVHGALSRPAPLKLLAAVMALAAIIWILWLAGQKNVDSQMGQIVAFVVSIWGFRAAIQPEKVVFPSISDYAVIGLILTAVAVVLVRWFQSTVKKSTKLCPQCKFPIPREAFRCGHCGQPVAPVIQEQAPSIGNDA